MWQSTVHEDTKHGEADPCIMGVWWLSWLHSRSWDQAQAAIEQSVASLGALHHALLGR